MKKEVIILLAIIALVAIGGVIGSSYYRTSVQKSPEPGKKIPEALIRSDSPSLGPADAKVTVVEFYDPECESCAAFHPVVKELLKEFEGKIRLVSRYATFHKNARLAAIYTEAAGEQGKYWEMQAKLFEKQGEWGEKHGHGAPAAPSPPPDALFQKYAQDLGLNIEQLRVSISDPKHAEKVDRDMRDVDTLNVQRTPTFYVNGRLLAMLNQQDLRNLIREELAKFPSDSSGQITRALYDQVRPGMSYQESKTILGKPGDQRSESEFEGQRAESYQWNCGIGCSVQLIFVDGKLVTKSQSGLK